MGVNHPFIAPRHLQHLYNTYPIAILLHDHCAAYAPPTDPAPVWHTPYNIGDGNIVLRPTRGHPAPARQFHPTREGYHQGSLTLSPARGKGEVNFVVVGCKIPWKENSLISRTIGDFSIYPARACFFSGKPGWKFQSTQFVLSGALIINGRVNLGSTRGNRKGGGCKKIKKIGEFSFRGILQPTTGVKLSPCLFLPYK